MGCGQEEEEGGDWMEDKGKGGVIRRKEGWKESRIDDRWKDGSNEGRNSEVKMEERTNGWKNEEQRETRMEIMK